MLKKHGSYYADWRDALGHRHRKAFPTNDQARAFKAKMQASSKALKKAPTSPRPTSSPTRGRRSSRRRQHGKRRTS